MQTNEWTTLFKDVESAIAEGAEPESAKGLSLADRWADLVAAFTGGHAAIADGVRRYGRILRTSRNTRRNRCVRSSIWRATKSMASFPGQWRRGIVNPDRCEYCRQSCVRRLGSGRVVAAAVTRREPNW